MLKKGLMIFVAVMLFGLVGKAQILFYNSLSGRYVTTDNVNFSTLSDKTGFLTGWTSIV